MPLLGQWEPSGAIEHLRHALAAIRVLLVTDIEDFTSLLARVGDVEALCFARSYEAVVRETVSRHGGAVIDHLGDGLLVEFPLVRTALGCAADLQRALERRASEHPEAIMRTRIGVHAGEPISEHERLFGICVNTAFRICDVTPAGAILVSDVVRLLAYGQKLQFVERGRFELKGVGESTTLHELVWDCKPRC